MARGNKKTAEILCGRKRRFDAERKTQRQHKTNLLTNTAFCVCTWISRSFRILPALTCSLGRIGNITSFGWFRLVAVSVACVQKPVKGSGHGQRPECREGRKPSAISIINRVIYPCFFLCNAIFCIFHPSNRWNQR